MADARKMAELARVLAAKAAKKPKRQFYSKDDLNYFPGEEEFVDRAAKAKARGRVELDTLDREVERPSIMDAEPAEENALVRQLRERRINTEKGLRKGPSSEGRNDIRKVPPGEDIDPLAKTVEGQAPRLENDPRLVDQKERVNEARQLLIEYMKGNRPSGMPRGEARGTLDKLVTQETDTLRALMDELMNAEGLR